jgi:hypothetical protein
MLARHAVIAIMAAYAAQPALAQHPLAVVRVRVVDTLGKPVPNADVSAVRGLKETVASGLTDSAGRRVLSVPRGDDEYQIVVRRIGFQRADQFFRPAQDSIALVVALRSTPRELPAMFITAEQNLKRKRYHIGADDIASATRPILDALDIVTKLRPDMMDPPGNGIFTRCGMYYVWVNGVRIVFPPIDPGLAIKTAQLRAAASHAKSTGSIGSGGAGRSVGYKGLAGVPVSVQSVLESIHPEHIEELNYVDCSDNTLDFARSQGAVFIALKPGIGYVPGRGSYVAEHWQLPSDVPAPLTAEVLPLRLLGVFDEQTGEPLPGADVVDVATGTFATTTVTGTISLRFLPAGTSALLVRKTGYLDTKLDVTISPRDTVPITLTLKRP